MNEFEKILDELDEILEDAMGLPFTRRCFVSRDKLEACMQDIRLNLPIEIKKARAIIIEREKIVQTAKSEAERTVRQAQDKAMQLLDEDTILREAQARANEIIGKATHEATQMKKAATAFVDGLLSKIEEVTGNSVAQIKQARKAIESEQR